jgi:uncharacterized protein YjbJ (UPF0337 family)
MAGAKDRLAGKAKRLEGKLTGDKAREAQGEDQDDLGRLKHGAKDAGEKVEDTAKGAGDRLKRAARDLTD